MNYPIKTILIILITGIQNIFAANNSLVDSVEIAEDSTALKSFWIYPDDPIILALDEHHRNYFETSTTFIDSLIERKYLLPEDSVPEWDIADVKIRLKLLDSLTPLPLLYNKPTEQILNFYLEKRRGMLSRVLGLSELYYPLFEEELLKNNMPVELKHLAVVESALVNVIKSRVGATGLWQFMYNTGKYLGMQIDTYVDERCDPITSTKMAVKYLKYLHGLYDDWYMALAAYNAGPGNVNKAIRRSGGKKSFWEIYDYLPRETRSYVPAFVAVNYLMNYPVEHNIRPIPAKYTFLEVDTVQVNSAVGFDQISDVLCISIEELQFLNPQYKQDYIPTNTLKGKKYALSLPYHLIGEFVVNESSIYNYDVNWYIDSSMLDTIIVDSIFTHVIRSGESLGSIANKYNISLFDLKTDNNIQSNTIHPGDKLKIKTKKIVVNDLKKSDNKKEVEEEEYEYYTIKRGDSLSEIADRFKGVTLKSLIKLNNIDEGDEMLLPGKVIKLRKN